MNTFMSILIWGVGLFTGYIGLSLIWFLIAFKLFYKPERINEGNLVRALIPIAPLIPFILLFQAVAGENE
jgi:hypothetical protein